MEGTLCYRHGHLPHGCTDCGHLWQEIATTAGRDWADKVVWPYLGPMSDEEAVRQHQALVDGSIVYGWGRGWPGQARRAADVEVNSPPPDLGVKLRRAAPQMRRLVMMIGDAMKRVPGVRSQ